MNPDQLPVIPTETLTSEHTTVPIIAQLLMLFVLLGGVFGTLFAISFDSSANKLSQDTTAKEPVESIPIDSIPLVQKPVIKDVSLEARAAYVWDVREQRMLYGKNSSEALPLASITKLMTSLIAYELLEPENKTTISLDAILQDGDSGLFAGERIGLRELSDLALISSSNDAAYELSASIGSLLGESDPTSQFIAGMNIRARELGLQSLQFKNATGLDVSATEAGAYGSARDVSLLLEYIIEQYPELLAATTETSARIYNESGAYHDASNTNASVQNIDSLLGSKTGYTDLAGGNLTVAFDAGLNRPIVVTVLGSTREGRFNDVENLIEEAKEAISTPSL